MEELDREDPSRRRYAVPFHDVWTAAIAAASARGWRVESKDPHGGRIEAVKKRILRRTRRMRADVLLDDYGLTTVTVTFSRGRSEALMIDPGQSARFYGRLGRALERAARVARDKR